MNIQRKNRLSGIELLKLIAMFLIVLSHTGPYYGETYVESYVNLRLATTNVQNLFLIFFVYLGQVGNCMFLACSAYFLLEQQTVKINKVLYFLGDCFFFSLTFLSVFLLTGWEIPKSLIFKQFFPITFESNWFIGCYLLLYIIHPALNLIIRNLSQKQLLLVDLAGLVLYSFLQMLVRDSFYYTRLVGFMLIYFLMAYCKQYLKRTFRNKKLNLALLIISTVLLIGLILVSNVLGLFTDTFCEKMLHYCIFVNPFIILIAFSAFYLCKEWNLRSNVVNSCASVTLYLYIIHENPLFGTYARPVCFAYIYQTFTYEYVALWALLFATICYVVSLMLALLYQVTLQRPIHKGCNWLADRVPGICDRIFEKLKKWE